MNPSQEIILQDGEVMLSARKAAVRLDCAADYVTKLCREGKLDGVRVRKAWYVKEGSIARFEDERAAAKVARSEELAELRRKENEQFQQRTIQREQSPITRLSYFANTHASVFAFSVSVFFGIVFFAGASFLPSSKYSSERTSQSAALITQIHSPFFTIQPSVFADLANFFGSLFGTHTAQVAQTAPAAPVAVTTPVVTPAPVATPTPVVAVTSTPAPIVKQTVVNQNTYPVRERVVVEATSTGISQQALDQQLNELRSNFSRTVTSAPTPYATGGVTNEIALSQRIDQLNNVTITGLTVHGTSNFSDSINLASGCFSVQGVCINGSGSATPAGSDGQIQFNTGGALNATSSLYYDNTTGFLGVGTSTPQSMLALGAGGVIRITSNDGSSNGCFAEIGGQLQYANDCSTFQAFTAAAAGGWTDTGTTVHLSTDSELVGIGTSTPYAKLTVWGDSTNATDDALAVVNSASTTLLTVSNSGLTTILALQASAATTTALFAVTASTTDLFASNFTLSGPLHLALGNGALGMNNGLVYAGATTTAGTGLAYSNGSFNVSGLTASQFASPNISQWTNNVGYLTSLTGAASSTLLSDTNIFTGLNNFTNASSNFAGTWQSLTPAAFQPAGSYATFGYPFPNNATTTGLGIYASSTIGNGAQNGGLTINGGATSTTLTLAGSNTTSFITPLGTGIPTKIDVPLFTPPAYAQVLAMGLSASAPVSDRVLTLMDGRTATHQPTLDLFSPNETQYGGLGWNGSNSTFTLSSTQDIDLLTGANVYSSVEIPNSSFSTLTFPNPGTTRAAIHLSPMVTADDSTTGITFGANDGGLSTYFDSAEAGIYEQSGASYGTKLYFGTTDNFTMGAKTRMTIDYTGNVGIGTINPSAQLEVNGTASTTNLTISSLGVSSGQCLTVNSSGSVSTTACGSGGGAFSFTPTTFGPLAANATSTLMGFTSGLYSLASSTIGNGAQSGGLTVNGGATTTGNAYFAGNVGIGTMHPSSLLNVHNGNLLVTGSTYQGLDASTVLLLHGNGTNGSTSFTDSSTYTHTVAASGDIQISTAQSELGGASISFDNSNSYLYTPYSTDFDFGSGAFTIDMWVYDADYSSGLTLYSRSSNNGFVPRESSFSISNASTLHMYYGVRGSNQTQYDFPVGTMSNNTWNHIAFTRDAGGIIRAFLNGVPSASTYSDSVNLNADPSMLVSIGNFLAGGPYAHTAFFIDELHISKGVAQWTSNFTPPMQEYGGTVTGTGIGVGVTSLKNQLDVSGSVAFGSFAGNATAPMNGLIVSGNVGIGTTSPWAKLSINNSTNDTAGQLLFVIASSTANATTTLFVVSNTGSTTIANGVNITSGCYAINGTCLSTSGSSFAYLFPNNATSTSLMLLASTTIGTGTQSGGLTISGGATTTGTAYFAGFVGIGTSSPFAPLSVAGQVVAQNFVATSTTATSTLAGGLSVGNGALQYDSSSGITSIDSLQTGNLTFDTDAGVTNWIDMPITSASANGTIESYTANLNAHPMITVYGVATTSDVTNLSVGIGTTTPWADFAIQANGTTTNTLTNVFVVASSTAAGANSTLFTIANTGVVTINGTVGTCILGNGNSATNCSSSDQRLKSNIAPLDASSSLVSIEALNAVSFDWNSWMQSNGAATTTQFGFIAQEMLKIFPNLVHQDARTGYYSLDYQGLFAPIVGAIQELSRRLAALETTVAGFADSFTSKKVQTDELCVGTTCVTQAQFLKMVQGSGQSAAVGNSGTTLGVVSTTISTASTTDTVPPVITLQGIDPTTIAVGSAYIDLGATVSDNVDTNLGIHVSVDGGATTTPDMIIINTSTPGTHTILFSATDAAGNTGYATRIVSVIASSTTDVVPTTTTN